MKQTIAIGILGFAICSHQATAQTVAEQAAILRDFQQSVVDYTAQHRSPILFPEALTADTPAPKIFTLPVAMVFRQLIAAAIAAPKGAPLLKGAYGYGEHHAVVMRPLPGYAITELPAAIHDALPPLPYPLEYWLVDRDLVIRDAETEQVIAVLRDAIGVLTTVRQ